MKSAFEIIPNALSSEHIKDMYARIIPSLPPAHPKQSGSVLTKFAHLGGYLEPLREIISNRFGCEMYLRLDKSSYRSQAPDGAGALPLHQDFMPLQDLRYRRFADGFSKGWYHAAYSIYKPVPYLSNPAKEPACTVWLPLVDIDDQTPTLEVSPVLPARPIEHAPDEAGYLLVKDRQAYADQPMVALTNLRAGTGVLMSALTLHRSCVRPWHTKTRESFDLRFLPVPAPKESRTQYPITVGKSHRLFYLPIPSIRSHRHHYAFDSDHPERTFQYCDICECFPKSLAA